MLFPIMVIRNKLSSECKPEDNSNKFKHKIKEEFFKNIQRNNDDIYIYLYNNKIMMIVRSVYNKTSSLKFDET